MEDIIKVNTPNEVQLDIITYDLVVKPPAYIAGVYGKDTLNMMVEFARNQAVYHPTEIVIIREDSVLAAFIYVFPTKGMHEKYLRENKYEDFNLRKLNPQNYES